MNGISAQYVDGLEFRIKELTEKVARLTGLVVMRFDHDVPPQFSQGYSEHEMVEPVTAEHCKWFVGEISTLRAQVAQLEMLSQARGDALMAFAVIREITGTQKGTLDDSINVVKKQSAALKLAKEALIGALSDDQPYINASKEAIAAINEVLGEVK